MQNLHKKQTVQNKPYKKLGFSKAVLLSAGLALVQCSKQDLDEAIPKYTGDISKDENKSFFQANTVLLWVKENITRDQVEELIKPYDGHIAGHLALLNTYTISLPINQREIAIMKLIQRNEVRGANRNYYDPPNYDNDVLIDSQTKGSEDYACFSWQNQIYLTEGLQIVKDYLNSSSKKLLPSTIAVIDPAGFDTKSDQINFVTAKYQKDFGQELPFISVDVGDFGRFSNPMVHGTQMSLIAAGKNDNKETNGVSILGENQFRIQPIRLGTLQFYFGNIASLNYIEEDADRDRQTSGLAFVYETAATLSTSVVSMSFGGLADKSNFYYPPLAEIIKLLKEKNIIVIASAGNESTNAALHTPSGIENVIAVGSTFASYDANGKLINEKRASFSNYSGNSKAVTISAPGFASLRDLGLHGFLDHPVKIAVGETVYNCERGTSISTPMVSGTVALIKALKPDADYDYVVKLLRDNADTFVVGNDDPVVEARGQIIYRLNVKATMRALITDLENAENTKKPENCKTFDSPYTISTVSDRYIVFDNPANLYSYYDLQKGTLIDVPIQSGLQFLSSYARIFRVYSEGNRIGFHCTQNGQIKFCYQDPLTKEVEVKNTTVQLASSYMYYHNQRLLSNKGIGVASLILDNLTTGVGLEIPEPGIAAIDRMTDRGIFIIGAFSGSYFYDQKYFGNPDVKNWQLLPSGYRYTSHYNIDNKDGFVYGRKNNDKFVISFYDLDQKQISDVAVHTGGSMDPIINTDLIAYFDVDTDKTQFVQILRLIKNDDGSYSTTPLKRMNVPDFAEPVYVDPSKIIYRISNRNLDSGKIYVCSY